MSCTEIYGFNKEGNAYLYAEVKNSFRSGIAVWRRLEKKYLPAYLPPYAKEMGFTNAEDYNRQFDVDSSRVFSMSNPDAMREIWNLQDDKNVSVLDKICLHTTFDNCLIHKEDIPRIVEAFRAFDGETSLPEQADILEKMFNDDNCIAVGWNQTSVNADTWSNYDYDEENDVLIPYNCITGTKHYWLFDDLNTGDET